MSQAQAGAMSGAASGAAAGAALGPYGMAAGAVIGGVAGFMSGSAADDAAEELEKQMEYQAALAQVQSRAKQADLVAAKEQARHKNVGEMSDMTIAFMKERANAVAGAGEAGVAGGSVARNLADKFSQESKGKARGEYNLDAFNEDSARAISGVHLGLAGQVNTYQGIDDNAVWGAALMDVAGSMLTIGSAVDKKGGWSAWSKT